MPRRPEAAPEVLGWRASNEAQTVKKQPEESVPAAPKATGETPIRRIVERRATVPKLQETQPASPRRPRNAKYPAEKRNNVYRQWEIVPPISRDVAQKLTPTIEQQPLPRAEGLLSDYPVEMQKKEPIAEPIMEQEAVFETPTPVAHDEEDEFFPSQKEKNEWKTKIEKEPRIRVLLYGLTEEKRQAVALAAEKDLEKATDPRQPYDSGNKILSTPEQIFNNKMKGAIWNALAASLFTWETSQEADAYADQLVHREKALAKGKKQPPVVFDMQSLERFEKRVPGWYLQDRRQKTEDALRKAGIVAEVLIVRKKKGIKKYRGADLRGDSILPSDIGKDVVFDRSGRPVDDETRESATKSQVKEDGLSMRMYKTHARGGNSKPRSRDYRR